MGATFLLAFAIVLFLPGPLLADKPDKSKRQQRGKDHVSVDVVFTAKEREQVRLYFVERHGRGHCPPGLAKKRNGCLPPGQAKKRYVVGRPLDADLVLESVPDELAIRLGAPPRGYRYAVVDGDVLKLVVGTLLVIDAISGLVD